MSTGVVTLPRVARAEWTKLWSVRSTRWSLLAAVLAMGGLGVLIAAIDMAHWNHMRLAERMSYNPIETGVGGYHMAQLAIGILGVLTISAEYSTGMIRSSLMAVPHRLPVLWAKLGVYAAVTFVLMVVSSFVAFFASQAVLRQHHVQASLGSPHALRVVIGAALFLTVLAMMTVGLGALTRNTAGGITAFVGLLFVLPGVAAILPQSMHDAVNPYLPLNAGFAIATPVPEAHQFAPWTGFAVFCGYAALIIAVAAVRMVRRDA